MAGSSTDTPSPNIFGGPAPPGYKKRKSELEEVDEMLREISTAAPKTKLVKQKTKQKDPPVGVKAGGVPDHEQNLTKRGHKIVIHTKKEEDKPVPHVPAASGMKYNEKKRKGAPPPPRTSTIHKRPMESGPPAKRTRRVSAHEI